MSFLDRLFGTSPTPSEALTAEVRALREEIQTLRLEWDAIQQRLSKWISRENARKRAALTQTLGGEGEDSPDSSDALPAAPQARKQALRQRVAQLRARG